MSIDLISLLYIALIIFVVSLVVAMIYVILILVDVRKTTHETSQAIGEVADRLKALTSFLRTLSALMKGGEKAKEELYKNILPSHATTVSFFAAIKEGLQVLLGGDGDDKEDD